MNCLKCGMYNTNEAKFCANCGNILERKEIYNNQLNNQNNNINTNSQNNINMNKKNNTNKIVIVVIVAIICLVIVFILFKSILSNDNSKQNSNPKDEEATENNNQNAKDGMILGVWYLYDENNVYPDNYFKFNDDKTYEWKAGGYIYNGTYELSVGVEKRDGTKIYIDNNFYIYFDVILTPLELTLSDGTKQYNELQQSEYAIAIKDDDMKAQNLESYNYYTLKRQ